MSKPVCRASGDWQKTACQLVLALCAAFKCFDIVCDAKLNCLIITSFKVQTGVKFECSPRAPVQSVLGKIIQSTSDWATFTSGDYQHGILRQRGTDTLKKV